MRPTALLARLAGSGFLAVLVGPFARAFLDRFGWSWPEAGEALAAVMPEGLAWHATLAPWSQLGLLLLLGLHLWAARRARPGQPVRRLLLRGALLTVSVLGAVIAVNRLALLTDEVVRHPLIEPPADEREFQDTLLAAVGRALLTMRADREIDAALAAGDVDRARLLVAATDLVGGTLPPSTLAAFAEATTWPATLQREGLAMMTAAATGRAESLSGLAAVLAVDLTPAGDLRDITLQLTNMARGDEVDRVILGLSVLGLGLTAGAALAPPAVGPALPGKAVLKAGARMGRLGPGLAMDLRRATAELVDLDGLAASARRLDLSSATMARHLRPAAAADLGRAAEELGTIAREAGPTAAILALRHADRLDDLPLLGRIARSFGDRAQAVLGVLGRDTRAVFRVWRAGGRVVTAVRGWSALLVSSLLAMAGSLLTLGAGRGMRLVVRAAARGQPDRPA